jgi:hypothetical protein
MICITTVCDTCVHDMYLKLYYYNFICFFQKKTITAVHVPCTCMYVCVHTCGVHVLHTFNLVHPWYTCTTHI